MNADEKAVAEVLARYQDALWRTRSNLGRKGQTATRHRKHVERLRSKNGWS